eukprot:TRINITY_DN7783_c0_g1_i1.p1 TRINITY_DN7783_c0_g1~~TRINITY_DN7783_c0_g1_i1.p1  ORF type:complete len:422 (+),score=91.73 TRINITY_DN7783_c0_g1_i1:3-1268(+)
MQSLVLRKCSLRVGYLEPTIRHRSFASTGSENDLPKEMPISFVNEATKRRDLQLLKQIAKRTREDYLRGRTHLLTAFYECGSLQNVEQTFIEIQSIQQPHDWMWQLLIASTAEHKSIEDVMTLFNEFKKTRLPSSSIWTTVIGAAAKSGRNNLVDELVRDQQNQLQLQADREERMRMSAEQQPSDLKNADVPTSSPMKFTSESSAPVEKTWKDIPHVPNPIALLDEMLTSGFVPTPSQWREMSILIAKWKPTSFPDLLNRIPHSVKPDPQIWNAGIWCQTESKNALDLFHQMKKFTHPNPQTWNVLFASLKKEDEEAPALIEEALKKNKDSLTRWSSLLLFTKLGQSTRALEIFRTLQAEDHVTLENWELFLRALWSAKETETALALFQEIPNPTPQLWSTMIQGFHSKILGNFQKFSELL